MNIRVKRVSSILLSFIVVIYILGNKDVLAEQKQRDIEAELIYLNNRDMFIGEGIHSNLAKPLTRYEFIEQIAILLFQLKKERESSFPDVTFQSKYYSDVALSQDAQIVQGFTDGTFGGERFTTLAQALSIVGRVVVNQDDINLVNKQGQAHNEGAISILDSEMKENILLALNYIELSTDISHLHKPMTKEEAINILYQLAQILFDESSYIVKYGASEWNSVEMKTLKIDYVIYILFSTMLTTWFTHLYYSKKRLRQKHIIHKRC